MGFALLPSFWSFKPVSEENIPLSQLSLSYLQQEQCESYYSSSMESTLKPSKYRIAGFVASATEVPWLHFLYLAVCFFAAVHDPLASIKYIDRTADSFATTAGTGSLARQISFVMLALYGVVHLPI